MSEEEKQPDYEHDKFILSAEQFVSISKGTDLRELCKQGGELDERNIRIAASMLLLMYRNYPMGLNRDEIWETLNKHRYDKMDDEEFQAEVRIAVAERMN